MAGSRTLKTLVGLGVLVAIAAGAAFVFWPQIFAAIEEDAIWSEKADHWHLYSSGKTLPGTVADGRPVLPAFPAHSLGSWQGFMSKSEHSQPTCMAPYDEG